MELLCGRQTTPATKLSDKATKYDLSTYNNPTGTKSSPKINPGIRISGSLLPCFIAS
jgi:hypothetical protein